MFGNSRDNAQCAGQTAVASEALEREAIFLLCSHAAKHISAVPLVQATLTMLAAQLGYANLPALMAWHIPTLVFDWWGNGYSLDQFLSIQVKSATTVDVLALNNMWSWQHLHLLC